MVDVLAVLRPQRRYRLGILFVKGSHEGLGLSADIGSLVCRFLAEDGD
jgi:hypothetical protein